MQTDLERERVALIAEHADLLAEHARLEKHPEDLAGHRTHSTRLVDHQTCLHAFVERLRLIPPA